ncbi:hypothetical protein Bca52824_085357 [Brassica carinata]|uniref:Uncharacterized protein n=1 Tax=Brassica carinata TaxID=52824 RepID=A0A8X7TL68_BRACI|nr:hypothetical protein Bca52824_085357 [Brassica carinata]
MDLFGSFKANKMRFSSLLTFLLFAYDKYNPIFNNLSFEDQISPEIAPLLPSPAATSTQTIPSTNSTLPDPQNDDVMADPDPAFAPSAPPPASSLANPSSQAPGVLLSVVFAAVSCFSLRLLAVSAL